MVTFPVQESGGQDIPNGISVVDSGQTHSAQDSISVRFDEGGEDSIQTRLARTGLPYTFIHDLIIKLFERHGAMTGMEMAHKLCLPFPLIDPIFDDILDEKFAEISQSQGLGHATNRFRLLERGIQFAQTLLGGDSYVGPAPVPLEQYNACVSKFHVRDVMVNQESLREAWREFVLDDEYFDQVGPAIRSGAPCFLYGPPGTGKTVLAKMIARFLDRFCGYIPVPYALYVGGSVIKVFDPIYHKGGDNGNGQTRQLWKSNNKDFRWVDCRRPTVIAGGELTMDMLDLRYDPLVKYYEAPLQLKANGGVFIIDDFGRQTVEPRNLLNRWILPLEERIDYLTLHNGKKFTIPFEQQVLFATNLNPKDLVDEAFLRRIRYKIHIGEISDGAYRQIFNDECDKKGIEYNANDLNRIMDLFYKRTNRMKRACDPRDITDKIVAHCGYNRKSLEVDYEMLEAAYADYMKDVITDEPGGAARLAEDQSDRK